MNPMPEWPDLIGQTALVRMRRPNGTQFLLRVPAEHLDRLIAVAEREFGGIVEQQK